MKLKSMKLRESSVEKYLVKEIRLLGGTAYKFSSPARRAVPDRLIVFPGLCAFFIECKAFGESLTPAQEREHKGLRNLNQEVFTVDSIEQIDELLKRIKC